MKVSANVNGSLVSISRTKNGRPVANILANNEVAHVLCSEAYVDKISVNIGKVVTVPILVYTDSSYCTASEV